ncbi:multicopper oxidase domain-containing protein [Phytoactinopolyspora endophytica]|uniref:multicopper oxidase domain-containing protein n=1 Tax=Phytoactinopolyspora endophytica TaxID=1642495 RepID=UPI00197BB0C4|nr:multicopper oxidase domain-containing protein [Phytoactinopolyspora endophytica]
MRKVFVGLAGLLVLAVVAQFYLAAVGAFDTAPKDDAFGVHRTLGYMILLLAVVVTIMAALVRMPGRVIGLSGLVAGLALAQGLIRTLAEAFNDTGDTTLVAAAATAVVVAGLRLFAAARRKDTAIAGPGSVVALLTAGYAGLAGLALTLVGGYPLTWSSGLVAVSLVIVAALVTWRAVPGAAMSEVDAGASGAGASGASPVLSRRRFIGVVGGTVAAGAGGTGVGLAFVPPESVDAGGGRGRSHSPGHGTPVTDLRGPADPTRGGDVRRHTLTARQEAISLSSGREVQAWTYEGEVPGPRITATHGDLVEVTLRNTDIGDGVTLHWHGYEVACGDDGAPGATQDAVMPGEEFVYRLRAEQVGTYWYHTHQVSHRGVRLGLYGTLVVTPRADDGGSQATQDEVDLTLPVHTFDGILVIEGHDEVLEHTARAGAPVRLRLVNTDSDPHRFALAGTPFKLAAVDGRDLNEPDEVDGVHLRLPAGGRYDLTFAMPDSVVALIVDNNRDGGVRLRPGEPDGEADVEELGTAAVEDTSGWPELDPLHYGRPAAVPFETDGPFDRDFTLVLDRGVAMVDGAPAYAHTVNGLGHPSIPEQLVAEGDLVRFTVVNRSLETHPWHLHGHTMLVLSRDGEPYTGSPLWVDTFDVRPGEVWEVAFLAGNPGLWMNHCHNLPHAEQGMMLKLGYDGVTSPSHGDHAEGGTERAGGSNHDH